MDLFQVKTITEVRTMLSRAFEDIKPSIEVVPFDACRSRVLAANVVSQENIPSFRRSTVDGYAVRASETAGASESIPAFLNMKGEILMGQMADCSVFAGEAVYVPTGGEVPEGADAVVMIEYAELFAEEIAIYKPVRTLENIMSIGDDVSEGQVVIPKGTLLKPQHIAVLASLGQTIVQVYARPKVAIVSTGDELIDVSETPRMGQIRDVNGYTLKSFLESIGCDVVRYQRVIDDEDLIHKALLSGITEADVVLVSGGSSVGKKDKTPELIHDLGEPGILVHGIAMKPGKPTIVAQIGDRAVFGLPGQPTSCLLAYYKIVLPFILETFYHLKEKTVRLKAKSLFKMHASSGRTELVMVKLKSTAHGLFADMIPGKSGMVTLLSEAVGFIEVPMERGGIMPEDEVEVQLFQIIGSGELADE